MTTPDEQRLQKHRDRLVDAADRLTELVRASRLPPELQVRRDDRKSSTWSVVGMVTPEDELQASVLIEVAAIETEADVREVYRVLQALVLVELELFETQRELMGSEDDWVTFWKAERGKRAN